MATPATAAPSSDGLSPAPLASSASPGAPVGGHRAAAAVAADPRLPPPIAVEPAGAALGAPVQPQESRRSHDLSRPSTPGRSQSSRDHTSPHKHTRHYKHHEAAPRKLLKRLNSLFNPSSQHHSKHSRPSSAASSRPASVLSSMRPSGAHTPLTAEPSPIERVEPVANIRPNLKLRLVTFNMHDSLPAPTGDLSEFLGDLSQFPEEHLPRKRRHSSRSSRGSTMTVPLPERDDDGLPTFPLAEGHPYHVIVVCGQECPTASGVLAGKVQRFDGKGWTSRLESYLCGGCSHSSPESSSDEDDGGGGGDTASIPSRPGRGPYVLVEKERLMGIYCAVFVAKCCEGLIKGVSTGRVTAGLMGGRMGNKGGVGISLHLHQTRLLFISAHLAAHASGLDFRKANALKILDELVVDDFWNNRDGEQGPRPEKLVDRFDGVFFAGDLNFRLNISRLHADWLVRAKDFSSALRFDQLRDVLAETGGCFDGFREGAIVFPPTYKLDVPTKKAKKKRSTLLRLAGAGRTADKVRERAATDPVALPLGLAPPPPLGGTTDGATTATEDDSISLVSSAGTISTMDTTLDCPLDSPQAVAARDDLSSLGMPVPPTEARKAQVRFLTLVKRNSNSAALEYARRARDASEGSTGAGGRSRRGTLSALFPPRPILRTSQSAVVVPTTTIPACEEETGGEGEPDAFAVDEETGSAEPVFDTSKKQRVQSWTDRILFRTHFHPPQPASPPPPVAAAPALQPVDSPQSELSLPPRPASADQPHRIRFGAVSTDTLASSPDIDEPTSLWRRAKSMVLDPPSDTSPPPSATTTPPRRPRPRKKFTLSGSGSSSDEDLSRRSSPALSLSRPPLPHSASDPSTHEPRRHSRPPGASSTSPVSSGFPRARTFSAALNKLQERAPTGRLGHGHGQSASASGASLNTRLKSFLSLLPLRQFASSPTRAVEVVAAEPLEVEKVGPVEGEVQIIRYDCVRDLARMGAVSDHRPVFLVCALGVKENETQQDDEGAEEERVAGR
ncbi:hypothetical protein JCM3775_004385 [Rhodotorula graminis]